MNLGSLTYFEHVCLSEDGNLLAIIDNSRELVLLRRISNSPTTEIIPKQSANWQVALENKIPSHFHGLVIINFIYLFIYLFIYFIYLFYLFILFIYLFYLFIFLFIYLYIYLFIYLFIFKGNFINYANRR